MDYLALLLRFLHIVGGIFWTGGALLMYFFIGPTIGATQQTGKQFAAHLMTKTRIVTVMTTAATITILAGAALYWKDSGGLHSGWMLSGAGIGYAIGGVAGLIGASFGIAFGNLNKKMALIGIQAKGQPTPKQNAQLQNIQRQIAWITPIHMISIIIAISFMATARYFSF